MKKNEAFPSNYLKAQDVLDAGGEMVLTVKNATQETLKKTDGSEEQKVVVWFNEIEKGIILNKTNWSAIETVTGKDDSDHWSGETLTIETQMISAFGETKPAVRVKLSTSPKKKVSSGTDATAQAFWSLAYGDLKLSPDEGNAIIAENGGDIGKALEAIQAQKDMM